MDIKKTFTQFFNKYNQTFVEKVDATNKNQCFDLAVAWLDELGLPRSFNHIYAQDIYLKPTAKTLENFDRIPNTPEAIPQTGDIVVWKGSYNGGVGHVGIATGRGTLDEFECFEQNDPIGSKAHNKLYSYAHVAGWLRDKRAVTQVEPTCDCEATKKRVIDLEATEQRLEKSVKEKDQLIQNLNQQINDRNNDITKLQSTISTLEATVIDKETAYNLAIEQAKKVPSLTEQVEHLEQNKKVMSDIIINLETKVKNLEKTSYLTAPTNVLALQIVKRLWDTKK